MGKKHDIKPFDDPTPLYKLTEKQDASLFVMGNNTKKRPNNIIIGRLYNSKILDMLELGITSFKRMAEFPNKVNFPRGAKPVMIFQGERFEYADEFIKMRNLLSDLFRVQDIENMDISQAKKIMVFTLTGEKTLQLRCFTSNLPSSFEPQSNDSQSQKIPEGSLMEVGPSITFTIRRTYLVSEDALRESLKKPKVIEKREKKEKNIEHNELGQVLGRLHVQQQDLSTLGLKHIRPIKKRKMENEKEEENEEMDEEEADESEENVDEDEDNNFEEIVEENDDEENEDKEDKEEKE